VLEFCCVRCSQCQRWLGIDFGVSHEFASVNSRCYEFVDSVDYIYSLCPFDRVTQRSTATQLSLLLGLAVCFHRRSQEFVSGATPGVPPSHPVAKFLFVCVNAITVKCVLEVGDRDTVKDKSDSIRFFGALPILDSLGGGAIAPQCPSGNAYGLFVPL